MMKWLVRAAVSVDLLLGVAVHAEQTFDADTLTFKHIFGQRNGDRTSYSVVGTGAFRAPRTDDVETFVATWLARHPHAHVTVVDQDSKFSRAGAMDYVWIDSGDDSLNLDLVRQGIFPGGTMADGVEYLTSIKDIAHLDTSSPDFPKRLVSDAEYEAFMEKVRDAEVAARTAKIGLWSDKYSEIMEQEGYR